MGKPWTRESRAKVRELFAVMSLPSLADLLGQPVYAVWYCACRLGLVERPMLDSKSFREEHAKGSTDKEMGFLFGVSRSTVVRWRESLGLSSNGKPGRPKGT
jgi:hypothetical protein